jgi:hypothetical protein
MKLDHLGLWQSITRCDSGSAGEQRASNFPLQRTGLAMLAPAAERGRSSGRW